MFVSSRPSRLSRAARVTDSLSPANEGGPPPLISNSCVPSERRECRVGRVEPSLPLSLSGLPENRPRGALTPDNPDAEDTARDRSIGDFGEFSDCDSNRAYELGTPRGGRRRDLNIPDSDRETEDR